MNCTICGRPIVLVPSAEERARKLGGKPGYYVNLFISHSDCALEKRDREVRELMRRNK